MRLLRRVEWLGLEPKLRVYPFRYWYLANGKTQPDWRHGTALLFGLKLDW